MNPSDMMRNMNYNIPNYNIPNVDTLTKGFNFK